MLRWIEDQALRFLQRRCWHHDSLTSVDILEGDVKDLEIGYCNRCGAVKIRWRYTFERPWRRPDGLWRGK
jgi:hypothetical protein